MTFHQSQAVRPSAADVVREANRLLVDELGRVKAQVADLKVLEKELRDQVEALGEGAHDGHVFRATVEVADRETLNAAKVKATLTAAQLRACTQLTQVISVKVKSRVA